MDREVPRAVDTEYYFHNTFLRLMIVIVHRFKQIILAAGHKSFVAPNKKAGLPPMTLTTSYSAVRLSVCMGSATFCPYLTIGLAFLFLRAVNYKINQYLLRKLVRNKDRKSLILTFI
jgi:hypothetical protein